MSRIDQLIEELCPNGVPYKELGEIGSFYSGLTGKSKSDFQDGNSKFATYMNVFSNIALNTNISDSVKVKDGEKQNLLQVGDILFTGSSETPDECGMSSVLTKQPFENLYLNSFCFGFRLIDEGLFLPDFSKYLFRSNALRKQIIKTASGVTRFNVSKQKMLKVRVPVPPLPVQEEIVRILDAFGELNAVLRDELEARNLQFYHYARTALSSISKYPRFKLGDLCEITKGKTPIQKVIPGDFPLVATTEKLQSSNEYQFDCKAVCVPLISSRGHGVASLSRIYYQEGKFALGNILCAIVPNDESKLNAKFLRNYLYFYKDVLLVPLMRGGANVSLTIDSLKGVKIHLPSLEKQYEINKLFDCFNELISSLEVDIALQLEQHKYYRDKLLTFKELEA